jgi:hypothetical protein
MVAEFPSNLMLDMNLRQIPGSPLFVMNGWLGALPIVGFSTCERPLLS